MIQRVSRLRKHADTNRDGAPREHHTKRRWLPLAMIALTLAGCARFATSTSTSATLRSTPAPTVTPVPLALPLRAATAPAGGQASWYAPAPSNGNIAYACGMAGSSRSPEVAIWSTQDRGTTWSSAVTFAVTPPASRSGCILRVDANDPRVLTVTIQALDGSQPPVSMLPAFISQDGGKTWQALPQAGPRLPSSLASYNGTLYAIGNSPSAAGNGQSIWVSTNGGRSWTARNDADVQPSSTIWLNPQTGDLLGASESGTSIYHSTDGGQSWTAIPLPRSGPTASGFIVAPNGSGWHICAASQTTSGVNTTNALTCSDDLGAAWTQQPALNPVEQSPKGFTFTEGVEVYAITDSGAILAWYPDVNASTQLVVLMPGASTWTPIVATEPDGTGLNPSNAISTLTYTPAPGDGMLWVGSGSAPPTPPFFTAIYP